VVGVSATSLVMRRVMNMGSSFVAVWSHARPVVGARP